MERVKQAYTGVRQFFESFSFFEQTVVALMTWIIGHINVCTGIVAFFVILFQLKVVYYKGKSEKLKYDKECQGK